MTEKTNVNQHAETAEDWTSDRGDVPGWVLITLMTAALVVVLWTMAAPALQAVFDQAMNKVVSF